MEIAGRGGRVARDCAAVVGAGERHTFAAVEPNRFLVLDIAADPQAPAGIQGLLDKLADRRYVTLTSAAHHLIGYAEDALIGDLSGAEARRGALWLELLLQALDSRPDPMHAGVRSLARATSFIDRSYHGPVRVNDVARYAGLGASRLHELFREHLGTTPRGYLAEVRLRHALALLAETRLSIAEIAVRTGHSDQSTMTRHLRRACGVTPAAYRRSRRSVAPGGGESAQSAVENVKMRC